ncbi:hypothetical protein ACFW2X_34520 [Streptomyces antibioticus]|uniref:hypothetical protein n=1 Tax=Streptomyces antibioticus TaxID=1890 RepID=UPI0036BBED3F
MDLANSPAEAGLSDAAVRHMVMAAAAMAAKALTDTEQPAEGRLGTLLDAYGRVQAARGPAAPLPFSRFRRLLQGDLARLLPASVPAEEMGPCPRGVDTFSCCYAASVRVADCCS